MSPGGLFSGAFGFGALDEDPLDPQPPAPAAAAAITSSAAAVRCTMARTVGPPSQAAARPRSREGQNCAARAASPATVPTMSGPGVLLIEDDEAIAAGLVRVLAAQGHAVERLATGARAVEAARDDVGLVILDLGLPDVDGLEVCRALRRSR